MSDDDASPPSAAPAPPADGDPDAVAGRDVVAMPPPGGWSCATVLVAERDPVLAEDLADIFTRAGFCVIGHAGSEEHAMRLASALRPDLVVLDVAVPGVHGLTAAGPICELQIPVILLMTPSEAGLVHEAVAAGAMAWLVKPIVPPSLVATAHMVLARHAELTTLRRSASEIRTRIEEHKLIERATGLLMARHTVAESVADEWMRQTAQDTGSSIARVAAAVVDEYRSAPPAAAPTTDGSTAHRWATPAEPATGADRQGWSRRRRSRGALQGG